MRNIDSKNIRNTFFGAIIDQCKILHHLKVVVDEFTIGGVVEAINIGSYTEYIIQLNVKYSKGRTMCYNYCF